MLQLDVDNSIVWERFSIAQWHERQIDFFHQIKIAQQYQIASPQMDSLTDHFGREIKQKLLQISIRSGAMNTSYDNSVMAKQVAHEKCANFLLDIKCVTASENNSIVNEE